MVGRCPTVTICQYGVVTPCWRNASFERILSKASSLSCDAVAGVGDPAIFQNLLDLPVFAESSVDRDEGEFDLRPAIRSPARSHRLP